MRNSVLAGLAIVAILDVVALVLMWEGGGSISSHEGWIGLSFLVLTGLPWSLLTDILLLTGFQWNLLTEPKQDFLFLAILVVCSLLNGGIVGFLIGKRREKPPTIRLK